MMVSEGEFTQISVRHTGSADGVINATYEVVEQFPRMIESAAQFGQLRLTEPERQAYATAALALHHDEGEAPVTAAQVMRPRRAEDADGSLWSAFNVAQEHLTQGG